jgi:hypothetical protein
MTMPFDPMALLGEEEDPSVAAEGAFAEQAYADALAASLDYVEDPNAQVEPNPPINDEPPDEALIGLQKALFGDDFPLANPDPEARTDGAWASWARGLWNSRYDAVALHLYLVDRNRLFRAGQQWLSSSNGGPWREPPKPRDAARVVYNMVDKALDQRLQILMDQRPGFALTPATQDPDDRRKAQAQQLALESQYEQCNMARVAREAEFWAQTDGVSFFHLFWDPDRGPWDERLGEKPGQRLPMGDLNCQVARVEQVRVSSNATATIPPYWVIIREVISRAEAANCYGVSGVEAANTSPGISSRVQGGDDGLNSWVVSQTTIGEGNRLRNDDTVERFTVYLASHPDALPGGLQLVIVGDTVVYGPSDLLWGVIPVVRVSDGSSDPSYYPRPVMEQWLDHQVRVNALLSKLVENIRVNAGGRFLTRPNAISTETFMGGVTSMIEVRGAGSMGDTIMPVQGFSVGQDVKDALALEKGAFEDASGWNAVSRGQVTGESGRAIIASREQLERVFSPAVNALAVAYTDWARVALAGMAWGYSMPRAMGAVGKNRPDLARSISQSDFDGQSDVKVEPATLMPMPMAFRLYLLDNWLQTGVIDLKEYRRRQMFAMAKDLGTPDEDQEARAKRVADAIRLRLPLPKLRWQDNEAIHQDVLEREILLQDDLDDDIVETASQRWIELANQATQKQQGAAPPGGGAGPGGATPAPPQPGPQAASVPPMAPNQLPLASGNPPMGVTDLVQANQMGTPDDERFAQMADAMSRQR